MNLGEYIMNKIIESRNKREGWYAGHNDEVHYRTRIKTNGLRHSDRPPLEIIIMNGVTMKVRTYI